MNKIENDDSDDSDIESLEQSSICEEVNGYSCYYEDKKIKKSDRTNRTKKNIIEIPSKQISKENDIIYKFKIIDNGKQNWPNDVCLKCLNNDSEIYFLSSKQKEAIIDGNEQWYEFTAHILFKSYKKVEKKLHILKGYLLSDKYGRIGNKKIFCYFGINVI
jgi:hypothetical protein